MYLLDTNIFSRLMKSDPAVWAKLRGVAVGDVLISVVSYAELHFGLAKKPEAVRQRAALNELLEFIPVAPFDTAAAESYGAFKAQMQKSGKSLTPLDLMIAAHARHLNAVLVSNDQAFYQIDGLRVEDWTKNQPTC